MNKEIVKSVEPEITCPYCDYKYQDSWEYGDKGAFDDNSYEEECENCGKKFSWERKTDVYYNSRGLCEENNKKHNWKSFDYKKAGEKGRIKGRTCLTCGKHEFVKRDEGATDGSLKKVV